MSLLSRPKNSKDSCYQKITPQSANWDFVGFEAHELKEDEELNWEDKSNECCLVVLSGIANISVEEIEFNNIGERMSVFDDINPHAVYVPNNKKIKADLLVIGAGAGGLSVAAGAAQLGVKVVQLEGDKMGGDCLNYGCVPSKALIAFSNQKKPKQFVEAMSFVGEAIKEIEPHDS